MISKFPVDAPKVKVIDAFEKLGFRMVREGNHIAMLRENDDGTRQYVMTLHAEEEMDEDSLTIFDVESIILTGEITERQKDANTGEWKYILKGEILNNNMAFTVGKIGPTSKLVIITVFSESESILICDICGKEGAQIRHVTRSYGSGASLLVIENVPVVNCPHCGETYLTADTLHEIERIKTHRKSFAKPRSVPVAELALK